ncbi:MAG: diphthine--ammonia ligase [Thaumarchaeota archaeon]|nr:diphthine--ammonia ligase [Nitrososphaerota archaeon]MDE1832212.1 diphthine--ammonia ligase [Nitrososphaerota archaeon]MDE1841918.1 diphthine--ammonia ligase [Nitrososphaerota archaeon]MDE1877831.1 diphthine--ammonia ligase [Nitrososphaerota archaeon]
MKLASLFSGGKDSTCAIYKAEREGHDVKCLVSIFPPSAESYLLHYPNMGFTSLQAQAMRLPQIVAQTDTTDPEVELNELQNLLDKAKKDFGIDGIVHGGLFSDYQRIRFDRIGNSLDLKIISPLWHLDQKNYLQELLESKFKFIVTSVTSAGLDQTWLGREIIKDDVEQLVKLSAKYGFNLAFEGGEAETFVVDCPLFYSPIKIVKANKIWDGYRGRFEITEAVLDK